jgi:hypothetical protein
MIKDWARALSDIDAAQTGFDRKRSFASLCRAGPHYQQFSILSISLMDQRTPILISRGIPILLFVGAFFLAPVLGARPLPVAKNSWRGITPLHSSSADVARILGDQADEPGAQTSGPFKVDEGEVTFFYITPSLAKIYRAPLSMVGKVFTIYVRLNRPMPRTELEISREFKRCTEDRDRHFYYFVSDAGVAYQFDRNSDKVETIIYQPTRVEVRRLAVNTECVF